MGPSWPAFLLWLLSAFMHVHAAIQAIDASAIRKIPVGVPSVWDGPWR